MIKKTRTHWIRLSVFLVLVAVLGLSPSLAPTPTQAQGPDRPHKAVLSERTSPQAQPVTHERPFENVPAGTDPLARYRSEQDEVNIIIELTEPAAIPAAVRPGMSEAQMAAAMEAQVARVEVSQQALLSALNSAGIDYQVFGAAQRVLNAVVVRGDVDQLPAIRALPGVKAAYPERIAELSNASSVPFIGAPTLWDAGTGYTGTGIRIGIIDSGIDYDHVNFGGNGDGTTTFPTTKVAGGYDFVGDSWSPGAPLVPDTDPMDQNGHGSHVAGTAAGFGVLTGATYGGPWTSATPFSTMDIGPGVAPEATLYAYKVGSSSNFVSEAAAILALDQAVLDGMDVVNMSIGGNYGDPNIGWAAAADAAAQAGVIVVSSAGNAYDVYFIQGDPSTADWAISVAASVDGSLGFEVTAPSSVAGTYEAASASFGPSNYDVTAPLEVVNDGTGTTSDGCEPIVGFTAGNIALIDRGNCAFTTKVYNAQLAGAVGVLVANTATGSFGGLGAASGDPLVPLITIPSVMIQYTDGQAIRGVGATVHMANSIVFGGTADTMASFSSRGPQREPDGADVGLKPDISAPGQGIFSTALGTGNGGVAFSGTSMASPHVAGAVALLHQLHPSWTVDEIKALVMNTATHHVYQGNNQTPPIYGPARAGVGRIDLTTASASDVIAYNASSPELVSVSFGVIDSTGAAALVRNITVENKGTAAVSLDTSFIGLVDIDGVSVSVSPATVNVPAGGTATVQVTLTMTDHSTWSQPHSHDPTVSETDVFGYGRNWLSEESGLVRLYDSTSGLELWVPVYAAVRPASTLHPVVDPMPVSGMTGFDVITMSGKEVFTGLNFPYDEGSVVSAFELLDTSPDSILGGVYDSGDLQYVGVTTDYNAAVNLGQPFANTRVYFGIATYGEWSSLAEETWFEIYVDSDQDGLADYMIYNWNLGAPFAGDTDDTFIVLVRDLSTGSTSWYGDFVNDVEATSLDTVQFQSNVMFMGAWSTTIGLSDTDGAFDFWVASWYMDGTLIDVSNVMTYDVTSQGIDFSTDGVNDYLGAPLWDDVNGPSVPVRWDWSKYIGPNPPCVLLLHHHNASGERADTVCLQPDVSYDVGVTKTVDNPFPEETDLITYTITAINNDPLEPVAAIVDDVLPGGLAYISDTASQGSYNPVSGQWAVGILPPGGSATLQLSVNPKVGTIGQTITNTATITGSLGTDTNPADNTASVDILVGGPSAAGAIGGLEQFDPAMSKVGELQAGGLGLPGEQLTWTIYVTNNGTGTVYNIPVVDTLRPELRVDGAEIDNGTVSIDGQTVTFNITSIAPGETVEMRIFTTVLSSPLDGVFVNEASIVAPDGQGGSVVLATARASVSGVSVLPSTGYPPED